MKVNEGIAIQTHAVVLVPYEAHHVPRYHSWMQDPAIREATASEELTLQEEFENQQSWRRAHDKLTFILCRPPRWPTLLTRAVAGRHDAEASMIGDVNIFLYPHEGQEPGDQRKESRSRKKNMQNGDAAEILVRAEVDIMIAERDARGRGVGSAAVSALLAFVASHTGPLLEEYAAGERDRWDDAEGGARPQGEEEEEEEKEKEGGGGVRMRLVGLMVKIKESNEDSIRLFRGLGFEQDGGVDYFREVKLVAPWDSTQNVWPERGERLGYREVVYSTST